MNPAGFFPTETGSEYRMPDLLQSLESHRESLSLFTNLDHPGVGGGHGCSNTFLNGVELKNTKDDPQRLLSLDQLLAEKIGQKSRFPSMLLGSGEFHGPEPESACQQADPVSVFNNLFVDDSAKAKQQQRRFLDEDTSILDVVGEDASLRRRLAQTDQQKLDQYPDFHPRSGTEADPPG